jgi:acyl-CoA thioesterase
VNDGPPADPSPGPALDPITDPSELARACADAMWAEDQASQELGMRLVDVGPGAATLEMTVRADMVNGHGNAHGGFVFLLADSAFAFACNGYDVRTVAYGCTITYLTPARLGDELTAVATERSRSGRTGTYDVTVRVAERVVAEFRGTSRTVGGPVRPVRETYAGLAQPPSETP